MAMFRSASHDKLLKLLVTVFCLAALCTFSTIVFSRHGYKNKYTVTSGQLIAVAMSPG